VAGVLAVSYGSNARPAQAGRPAQGGVPAWAPDGARLTPGTSSMATTHCARMTKAGIPCTAPPANGTDACVGHLRSEGRL
jgi:hypothetical protein